MTIIIIACERVGLCCCLVLDNGCVTECLEESSQCVHRVLHNSNLVRAGCNKL